VTQKRCHAGAGRHPLSKVHERRCVESMTYYVYILASGFNGTLYIGVTNDLIRRVTEHRTDAVDGFTKRYGVHRLVHFESCDDVQAAIAREKALKEWKRDWKKNLIERDNPTWRDLYDDLVR
jgi:putative endonuclease